jgi:hypothetical protein
MPEKSAFDASLRAKGCGSFEKLSGKKSKFHTNCVQGSGIIRRTV